MPIVPPYTPTNHTATLPAGSIVGHHQPHPRQQRTHLPHYIKTPQNTHTHTTHTASAHHSHSIGPAQHTHTTHPNTAPHPQHRPQDTRIATSTRSINNHTTATPTPPYRCGGSALHWQPTNTIAFANYQYFYSFYTYYTYYTYYIIYTKKPLADKIKISKNGV